MDVSFSCGLTRKSHSTKKKELKEILIYNTMNFNIQEIAFPNTKEKRFGVPSIIEWRQNLFFLFNHFFIFHM